MNVNNESRKKSKKLLKLNKIYSIIHLPLEEERVHNMKKTKILTTLLALVLLMGCTFTNGETASAATRYSSAPAIYGIVGQGYNGGSRGPISITRGTLVKGGRSQSVYLVTLSGTEFVKNQSTGVWTDILAGFNLNNAFVRNVVNAVNGNVPRGSNIIFAGHSLGGMVAQQAAADGSLKANFNILNTVCYGSPLLAAGSREGDVKRLGDTSDVVPYASGSTINNAAWAIGGLNRENGGYGANAVKAHTESYGRYDVWGAYDVLGQKWGGAYLDLDLGTQRWFRSSSSGR